MLVCLLLAIVADDAAGRFADQVQPILEQRCIGCHDQNTLDGGVGLDRFYFATQPTDSGQPLIVPGDPERSVLLSVLLRSDPEDRMPKDDDPLSPEQVATIRQWIADDGHWPDDGWRPPPHWSFVPPKRQPIPPPVFAASESRDHIIDRFVDAQLATVGLTPNPPAQPARLIRRVFLDLIGLPPTVEQVDAFVADPSEQAYAAIVEELLASPSYGERWAVHWLDLARYADSEGYQRDAPRSMWAYRDWVIDALNRDLPFDQFTIEQIAGDLLPGATAEQIVATAFHRNAPTNLEAGTDPNEDRYKTIVDRVNTTGTVWLGLTVGCAQCHNHKYDPLTSREYYELYAFFDQQPMETRQQGEAMGMSALEPIGPELKLPPSAMESGRLQQERSRLNAQTATIERDLRERIARRLFSRPSIVRGFKEPLPELLEQTSPWTAKQAQTVFKTSGVRKTAEQRDQLSRLIERAERLDRWEQKSVRVMRDQTTMRETFVAQRGDFLSPGVKVSAGTPRSLHPLRASAPRNRLGLARWLVDPGNPLVARAMINRLWIELFGQGLVTTAGDFGTQGAPPTHPELLDELAVRFVEDDGWSIKRTLHRIVLSATYRQSVATHAEGLAIDPRNQWLWRHPGHRLSAEIIRDNALAISGLLSDARGGPSVRP